MCVCVCVYIYILQVTESNRNKEVNLDRGDTSEIGSEKHIISQKRKLSSPVSPALPNKVS